jgi:hypothetical protein
VGVVGAEVGPSPADVIAPGPARILEIKHWGDRPLWLTWALDGLQPAPDFSKFRIGMAAMERKLQPHVHPHAHAGVSADTDIDAEADAVDVDVTTYFAPMPGTA